MGMNLPPLERPFSAQRPRLWAAAGMLVALFASSSQASIIMPLNGQPADVERILADLKSSAQDATTSSGAGSAPSPSRPADRPPPESDHDALLFARTLAHSDGNMGSSSSSATGGASSPPAALPGAAVTLTGDPLSNRLAAEASAFLPDPPLDGTLRPPQWSADIYRG